MRSLSAEFKNEDQSFEEQMNDLGVPVEKVNQKTASPLSDWIGPGNKGGVQKFDLSLRKNHLAINAKWMRNIAGDRKKVNLQFRIVEFVGKPALFFRENQAGFSLKKPALDTRAWQMTMSPMFLSEIKKHKMLFGHYTINIIKGGYLAVFDG